LKKTFPSVLKSLHFLSLDVAAGAVISSWMFWKLPLGTGSPDRVTLITLGICTWFIYLTDRLLDIIHTEKEELTHRHSFIAKHQYNIQVLTIALGLAGSFLCFFMPLHVLFPGIAIALCMGGYFFLINKTGQITTFFTHTKEIAVTIIYTAAVVGIPLYNRSSLNLSDWILAACFLLIVFQNLITFSLFEHLDNPENHNIVRFTGKKAAKRVINFIALVVIFTAIFLFSGGAGYTNKVALIEVLMTLTLSFMPALPAFFAGNERYRWLGDLVFLYPLLILFA